jgi:4a-hydroxytetrahydrobiopterin dehydratase
MIKCLNKDSIDTSLTALNSSIDKPWGIYNNKLSIEFKFSDFISAFGFMTKVAILAERANHHPEWSNIYSKVSIQLTTHEVSGISKKDFDLAQEISNLV